MGSSLKLRCVKSNLHPQGRIGPKVSNLSWFACDAEGGWNWFNSRTWFTDCHSGTFCRKAGFGHSDTPVPPALHLRESSLIARAHSSPTLLAEKRGKRNAVLWDKDCRSASTIGLYGASVSKINTVSWSHPIHPNTVGKHPCGFETTYTQQGRCWRATKM